MDDFIFESKSPKLRVQFSNFLFTEFNVEATDDLSRLIGLQTHHEASDVYFNQEDVIKILGVKHEIEHTWRLIATQNLKQSEQSKKLKDIQPF